MKFNKIFLVPVALCNKYGFRLLLLWVAVLFILYSLLSVVKHERFESGGFDLGIYDQAVWQYSRFQYPYNTIKDRLILGDHMTLTLPLLAPLFWVWNDVKILLLFQSFWISISAIPVFLLIKQRGYTAFTALCLSVLYSLFYGLQFLIFFDFHPVAIGVGILAWIVYFLEAQNKKLLYGAITLLLFTQENMGIALACIGLIYLFQKKFRKAAIGFIVGGIIASVISALSILLISPIGFEYTPKPSLQPLGLVNEYFNAADKQTVWLYSYTWFSFLPLLSPGSVLAVLLDLSQYFLSGEKLARMWSPFMHHRATLGILLLLGTLDTVRLFQKKKIKPEIVSVVLIMAALFFQFNFHFALNKLTKKDYWRREVWMDNNKQLFTFIPDAASVAAAQNLVPHLSHRNHIYLLYPREHAVAGNPCGQDVCWWLDFAGKPQYLVVDMHPNQWVTQLLESNEHFSESVKNMEQAKKIRLVKQVGDARLYTINY